MRWDDPIVDLDPHRVLFVQTSDPAVFLQHLEGMSVELLIREADYRVFAMRLVPPRIDAYDPEMVHQPPGFLTEVEYEYEGVRRTESLTEVPTMVSDFGMDSWSSRVIKVASDIHWRLWRTANR